MGVDVPTWKCMVCCRPTKSLGLWWQMAGRIQRPSGNYQHALILDHSDNALTFGFPDEDVEWSLQSDQKVQEVHAKKTVDKVRRCPRCGIVCKLDKCPGCGYEFPVRKVKSHELVAGELRELERVKRNRTFTKDQKQAYWNKLMNWARFNNFKIAAASCRYQEYFGVWPNSIDFTPRNKSESQMLARDFYDLIVRPQQDRRKSLGRIFGDAYQHQQTRPEDPEAGPWESVFG